MEALFDARAFAKTLREAIAAHPALINQATLADEAGVSRATVTRALAGEPNLSHENVLRLQAWLDNQGKKARAA